MISRTPRTVLLTGATGFLGKVALSEMMRRKDELNIESVILVVRGKGARSAHERFMEDTVPSVCFANLPKEWVNSVRILDGDLASDDFGTSESDREILAPVTHVVHSAAAVSFTLPAPVAAKANITTSVNLLNATRACPNLQRIVYVSTAYVTPHHDGKIQQQLVKLPVSADELYAQLEAGKDKDEVILARTGHPNTYTMTKTVAEHIVAERRGNIPVSIVRPSIISASRQYPMPGWIDSTAGFGAFVLLIGLGHLRAVVGKPDARLDLIPVDEVTDAMLDEMVKTDDGVTVRHSVAGVNRAPTVNECWEEIERHFLQNPVQRRPARRYLGPRDSAFHIADMLHHRVPITLGSIGSPVRRRQAKKLTSRMTYLNEVFPYFTTRTFNFDLTAPGSPEAMGRDYVELVCRGISRHLLEQRDDEWTLAGRAHIGHGGDFRWAFRHPTANSFVKTGIWLSTKVLRRIAESVTVDIPSFERVRDTLPPGAAIAFTPSHRSFLDFVLCSYLAFARPDLGIRVPYVAAATEFGRIPLLGRLLRSVHAFYVDRKASKDNRDLPKRVNKMIEAGEIIEFFIEGQRSRSREFLRPKRGLLRCLEESGRTCVCMPIAMSYDRVPEEAVFARELAGGSKAGLSLGPFLGWLADVWRGKVNIGRIHIACGAPVIVDATHDSHAAGDQIINELRRAMAVTSFHVDAYVASNPGDGLDAGEIRARIARAGVRLLESKLPVPPDLSPEIARTMREHFAHLIVEQPETNGPDTGLPHGWARGLPVSSAVA